MRAHQFISEETFGTSDRRPSRAGSRPSRGHETQPRYRELGENESKYYKFAELGRQMMDWSESQTSTHAKDDKMLRILNAVTSVGDKLTQMGTLFGPKDLTDLDKKIITYAQQKMRHHVKEHGPTTRKLCLSTVSDSDLGASALASCKSQGLRARDGNKSHLIGHGNSKVRIKVGGKKIKGKAHGGPLPDYGTRKSQK
jgi:hypothetical protein